MFYWLLSVQLQQTSHAELMPSDATRISSHESLATPTKYSELSIYGSRAREHTLPLFNSLKILTLCNVNSYMTRVCFSIYSSSACF